MAKKSEKMLIKNRIPTSNWVKKSSVKIPIC